MGKAVSARPCRAGLFKPRVRRRDLFRNCSLNNIAKWDRKAVIYCPRLASQVQERGYKKGLKAKKKSFACFARLLARSLACCGASLTHARGAPLRLSALRARGVVVGGGGGRRGGEGMPGVLAGSPHLPSVLSPPPTPVAIWYLA